MRRVAEGRGLARTSNDTTHLMIMRSDSITMGPMRLFWALGFGRVGYVYGYMYRRYLYSGGAERVRCVFLVLVYVSRFMMTGEAARMDAVYTEKYRKKGGRRAACAQTPSAHTPFNIKTTRDGTQRKPHRKRACD